MNWKFFLEILALRKLNPTIFQQIFFEKPGQQNFTRKPPQPWALLGSRRWTQQQTYHPLQILCCWAQTGPTNWPIVNFVLEQIYFVLKYFLVVLAIQKNVREQKNFCFGIKKVVIGSSAMVWLPVARATPNICPQPLASAALLCDHPSENDSNINVDKRGGGGLIN